MITTRHSWRLVLPLLALVLATLGCYGPLDFFIVTESEGEAGSPVVTTVEAVQVATVSISPYQFGTRQPVVFQPDTMREGCDWQGVAGQVLFSDGSPGVGYMIRVTGDRLEAPLTTISGTAPEYGPSGWEIQLTDMPSDGTYRVELLTGDGEQRLAEPIFIGFAGQCDRNLALFEFVAFD